MAQLTQNTQSDCDRPRIQFSMNRELFKTYRQILALAEKRHVTLNFRQDFEEWFGNQLNQLKHQLAELDNRQEDAGTKESAKGLVENEDSLLAAGSPSENQQAEIN